MVTRLHRCTPCAFRSAADRIHALAAGKRVREEEDQDGDGRPEVVTTFDGEIPLRREADTNGDGRPDTFISFRDGRKVGQEEDRDEIGRAHV